MPNEINVSVVETEQIVVSLIEPQPINIEITSTDIGSELESIFDNPDGTYRITKMYVVPHGETGKLKVEYET